MNRKYCKFGFIRSVWFLFWVNITFCAGHEETNCTMKAVVLHHFGLPSALRIDDVPIPTVSENEVLVEVKAAGLNPVDSYVRSGKNGPQVNLPVILGKEIAGIVKTVHESVWAFKPGDRVFCGIQQGGYAEFAIANATDCFPLSEKLSFSQGAALYTNYFTIYRGLMMKGHIREGSTVLVHGGSGSLGTAAVQLAKHIGAFVIVSVGSGQFKDLMLRAGADYIVFHDPQDENYLIDAVRQLSTPGFDVILEIVSNINVPRDKRFLNKNGKMIVLGNRASFRANINNAPDPRHKMIESVNFFQYTQDDKNAAAEYVLGGIECGCIRPYIGKEYKLNEIATAHSEMSHSKSAAGKLTVVF